MQVFYSFLDIFFHFYQKCDFWFTFYIDIDSKNELSFHKRIYVQDTWILF